MAEQHKAQLITQVYRADTTYDVIVGIGCSESSRATRPYPRLLVPNDGACRSWPYSAPSSSSSISSSEAAKVEYSSRSGSMVIGKDCACPPELRQAQVMSEASSRTSAAGCKAKLASVKLASVRLASICEPPKLASALEATKLASVSETPAKLASVDMPKNLVPVVLLVSDTCSTVSILLLRIPVLYACIAIAEVHSSRVETGVTRFTLY
mgnify:CR=1 FL=1